MDRITELMEKLQGQQEFMEEQSNLVEELRGQVNAEQQKRVDMRNDCEKLAAVRTELEDEKNLGFYYKQRIEKLNEAEEDLKKEMRQLRVANKEF